MQEHCSWFESLRACSLLNRSRFPGPEKGGCHDDNSINFHDESNDDDDDYDDGRDDGGDIDDDDDSDGDDDHDHDRHHHDDVDYATCKCKGCISAVEMEPSSVIVTRP